MPDENIPAADGGTPNLPAEAPANIPATESPPAEAAPQEGTQPEAKPTEEPKTEPQQPDPAPEGTTTQVKPRKAGPIADLLAKKHESDTRAEAAERRIKELEQQLANPNPAPTAPQTDDKIQVLADKYGLEREVLSDIIATAREGISVDLPQDVKDIVNERNFEKQQQAEIAAFDNRLERLSKLFPNEPIKAHRDRLMALAYSDGNAPDGEAYSVKELSEIYFGYVKPEVEPGKRSGEANATSGTRATAPADEEENAWKLSEAEFKKRQDQVRAKG